MQNTKFTGIDFEKNKIIKIRKVEIKLNFVIIFIEPVATQYCFNIMHILAAAHDRTIKIASKKLKLQILISKYFNKITKVKIIIDNKILLITAVKRNESLFFPPSV